MDQSWLSSQGAAEALSIHVATLKRWRSWLTPNLHYRLGRTHTSPILWNVPAIREELDRQIALKNS